MVRKTAFLQVGQFMFVNAHAKEMKTLAGVTLQAAYLAWCATDAAGVIASSHTKVAARGAGRAVPGKQYELHHASSPS